MINVVNKQVNTKLIFWGHKSNLTKLNNKKYKDYEITKVLCQIMGENQK